MLLSEIAGAASAPKLGNVHEDEDVLEEVTGGSDACPA